MSAQPTQNAAPDLVNIEVDGKPIQVPKGSMIIEATDKAGIPIPRFCYHRKLPVAASCRQCLVEVERMPKPAPACATPVMEGMKVFTRSEKALKAQRNVMEFLLINHPLDCPVCDQGGECELQDLAMGYGRSVSRFTERKRVIADEDIGPLVATEMTRCIHCTRCVRFVGEIAGTYELGSMDRGDRHVIGTYIGKNVESELSGNIIDVCPVGALTDKVFRFKARAWEMIARPSGAYHDALGSNLWLHTRRGEVLRVVPRDNEAVNECWLSDRDRYSHQGLGAADRAAKPAIKRDGRWVETDWDDALGAVAQRLQGFSGGDIGALVQPSTSSEEGALIARLMRALGSAHVDHRLRTLDFAGAADGATFELPVAQMEQVGAALLIGSDLRHEVPLLNHRVRQAWKRGAKVYAVNPARFDFNYDLAGEFIAPPQRLVDELLVLAKAAAELGAAPAEAALAGALAAVQASDAARAAVKALQEAPAALVLLGDAAVRHPEASWLRALARYIATATGSALNALPDGANGIGLARAGVLPGQGGLDAQAMLAQPRKAYVLYGAEPPHDFADGVAAMQALQQAEFVVAFAAYADETLRRIAHVILPIGLTPEIDATLVNVDATAQAFAAGAKLPGEARPGWKALRALGGMLKAPGFEFTELAELRAEIAAPLAQAPQAAASAPGPRRAAAPLARLATVPIYRGDAVLRRCAALGAHPLSRPAAVRLNAADAAARGLADGDRARLSDGSALPVVIDAAVPPGAAWIEATHAETAALPPYGAAIELTKA
ncbi:MAG: NADH-quinone oxidoreductase subunit NuoG [Mizugakiibacter sp.]|uniref:NADH-quinone oxidoreductase subunit NuoG n=1 Tax=Mizugakiibacter sp. TaxID=1972610 RepID=UPI0031C57FA0|nr:NADH-quinone oxidoreductase subunit NuoG [Xanthomonadaceae bacterium]